MKKLMLVALLVAVSMPVGAFENATEARNASVKNKAALVEVQSKQLIDLLEAAIKDSVEHGAQKATVYTGMAQPFAGGSYFAEAKHNAIAYLQKKGYAVSYFGGFLAPEGIAAHWDALSTTRGYY